MKHADIDKICAAGLITPEQRDQIVRHFKLNEEANRFLTIVSFVGAALVACGVILLIASNWDAIPRGVKIASGLALMLGAHAGGYYLRDISGRFPRSGEALHLAGSGLFLGNIALIGQIYHLSSRPPNAILLWWGGIALFPFLLRSKAQHLLSLMVFAFWFGMEINQPGSPIYFGEDEYQILLYAMLGLIYLGLGYALRGTRFEEFASCTEKLGLLGFLAFSYPLTWSALYRSPWSHEGVAFWVFPAMALAALGLTAYGAFRMRELSNQWRWTWALALAGCLALLGGELFVRRMGFLMFGRADDSFYHWFCAVGLFVFALLQVQVGVQRRSNHMVNFGVAFVALDIIACYLNLFGSMAHTGLVFLFGGIFLIGLGVYLEKKRRTLVLQIKSTVS
jgi:uncharacterized membrane protein